MPWTPSKRPGTAVTGMGGAAWHHDGRVHLVSTQEVRANNHSALSADGCPLLVSLSIMPSLSTIGRAVSKVTIVVLHLRRLHTLLQSRIAPEKHCSSLPCLHRCIGLPGRRQSPLKCADVYTLPGAGQAPMTDAPVHFRQVIWILQVFRAIHMQTNEPCTCAC